jgi:PAS domain S-box-containing protein
MEDALRASEERMRLAVEAARVGTWTEIVGTERLNGGPQFLALCGLPPDRQPSIEEWFAIVHPEDRDRVRQERRLVVEAQGGHAFEFEYRVIGRGGGEPRWVECRGEVLVTGDQPERKQVIGVLRDTTKRHHVDELRKLAAGIIAHDLRSPLSAIKLTGEMLIEHEALPKGVTRKLELVVRKVDRMVSMIKRLLDYTQAEFGSGLSLEKGFTDLEQICSDAIDDLQASHPDDQVPLETDGDPRGVWDRTRLTEVVTNLLGNAYKHGQPEQPIDVLITDEGDQVSLHVHNSGPPIPKDSLAVIFEPFRRAEQPQHDSREDSFGLGLYIVREIVAAHGGTVEVRSSAADGTTFIVHLPRGALSYPTQPGLQP